MMANLPLQTMPFIGRTDEITAIVHQLTDPACCLLTLVGPGGMGKTRLAIEVAKYIAETRPPVDGIYYVDLQPVISGDVLMTTIANTLAILVSGSDDPRTQLLAYLNGRNSLILLDNFEQLLGSVDLLTDIVKIAPDVKLLVTSREALNIQEEWVWEVGGLQVPGLQAEASIESYSAVQLFVERARRSHQNFTLIGQETVVTRTCQLVEGMPLAIELAASWIKALSCTEIAIEIQRGLDFLTTNKRNVLERHQSMQVVFDHSWRLLTEAECQAFPRLSVFRGGFRREAAEYVAGASLAVLAGLVDKSFLRVNPDGRYDIHELIRQYAEERLDSLQDAKSEIQERHCIYFSDFLVQHQATLRSSKQATALDEIGNEMDNIRVSWESAVEHDMQAEITQSMHSLYVYCHIRSQALEGHRLFDMAIKHFEQQEISILAYLLLAQISMAHFNGKIVDSDYYLTGIRLAYKFWHEDQIAVLLRSYYVAEDLREKNSFDTNQQEQVYRDFLEIFRLHGQRWGEMYMLFCLGDICTYNERLDEAENYARQSFDGFLQLGDRWGCAWATMGLAWVYEKAERYYEALHMWQEHQEFCAEGGDPGGVVYAFANKARIAWRLNDYSAAKLYIAQAIKSHLKMGSQLSQLDEIFRSLIALMMSEEKYERAVELASFLQQHADTASAPNVVVTARQNLALLMQKLPSDIYHQALERGKTLHMRTIFEPLIDELSEFSLPSDNTSAQALSQRELEVLRLTAAGHSNRQIAHELVLTLNTVKSHIHHIYGKLGVASRTQAVARARELNLL